MKNTESKEFVREFERMLATAELKVLSKHSLENPLTDNQYERMMELKKIVLCD